VVASGPGGGSDITAGHVAKTMGELLRQALRRDGAIMLPARACNPAFPHQDRMRITHYVFIIVDGEAEMVTGGTMIEPQEISPGQTRGKGIIGGVTHHLSKGDVITIAANTPHWCKDTSKTGSVGYYAVNFTQ
jgi:mannose-6-phosphate isomerase-like protein (cupin superfamily)